MSPYPATIGTAIVKAFPTFIQLFYKQDTVSKPDQSNGCYITKIKVMMPTGHKLF